MTAKEFIIKRLSLPEGKEDIVMGDNDVMLSELLEEYALGLAVRFKMDCDNERWKHEIEEGGCPSCKKETKEEETLFWATFTDGATKYSHTAVLEGRGMPSDFIDWLEETQEKISPDIKFALLDFKIIHS